MNNVVFLWRWKECKKLVAYVCYSYREEIEINEDGKEIGSLFVWMVVACETRRY
jgi:hypothetical protein